MGCGTSKIDDAEKYAVEQNARIERRIRQDRKVDARTVKILLLGTHIHTSIAGVFRWV